jgi:hypothetical protein
MGHAVKNPGGLFARLTIVNYIPVVIGVLLAEVMQAETTRLVKQFFPLWRILSDA